MTPQSLAWTALVGLLKIGIHKITCPLRWVMKWFGRTIEAISNVAERGAMPKFLIFICSTAFSWYCYTFAIETLLKSGTHDGINPIIWGGIIALSVVIHELAHYFGFKLAGLKSHIIIIIIGGITCVDESEDEKIDQVSKSNIALTLLAGVVSNLFLMAAGVLFYYLGLISPDTAWFVVFLNVGLAAYNLLPISNSFVGTDGTLFMDLIFSNAPSKFDINKYVVIMTLPVLIFLSWLLSWMESEFIFRELVYISIATITFGAIGLAKISYRPIIKKGGLSNKQLNFWATTFSIVILSSFASLVILSSFIKIT